MGVDFYLFKTWGLLIPCNKVNKLIIADFIKNDINFYSQDCYGSKFFVPHIIIPIKYNTNTNNVVTDDVEYILKKTIGDTKMSLITAGVYSDSDILLGGANIPQIIKLQSYNDDVNKHNNIIKDFLRHKQTSENLINELLNNSIYGYFLFSYFY